LSSIRCKLKDPFPIMALNEVNLGNADGHRDELVDRSFIMTESIKRFLSDRHSIVKGAFGSGKSTLFNMMKNKSDKMGSYCEDLIVPIEDKLQFSRLKRESKEYFPDLSEDLIFQLLWKLQFCRRASEEISRLDGFPKGDSEKRINEFIGLTGGSGFRSNILDNLKKLFENSSFNFRSKLSDLAIDINIGGPTRENKRIKRVEVDLDEIVKFLVDVIDSRGFRRCTFIIDKLDKFVAGEDYKTQKLYIESLLEIEDEMYDICKIGFKIFLRSDLYERLDFSSLGPDKVSDNTLSLVWSANEINSFIAKRLFRALDDIDVWDFKSVMESSNNSEFKFKWYEKAVLEEGNEKFKYKLAAKYKKYFGRDRRKETLYSELDQMVIDKLFEYELEHEASDGKRKRIRNSEFFKTHFLDGNDACTPRYILIFLKNLFDSAYSYYRENPLLIVNTEYERGSWVYNLFKRELVYISYLESKGKYIDNICCIDDKWTKEIKEFLGKAKSKTKFDYKWINKNIEFNGSEDAETFLIFLQVIGFLKPDRYVRDIKKRTYQLPILYKSSIWDEVT